MSDSPVTPPAPATVAPVAVDARGAAVFESVRGADLQNLQHIRRAGDGRAVRAQAGRCAMKLDDVPVSDLVAELTRRGAMPRCRCGKWNTYLGHYDADGHTLRCHGCLRAIAKCTC